MVRLVHQADGSEQLIGRRVEDYQTFVRLEMGGGVLAGDPLDSWEHDSAMRERVRPMIADEAKTEQFLAARRLTLDSASRTLFLDYVARVFFAAVALRARGDYGPDK
ncbi:MAG: hypothetical protein ACLPX7_12420 [Xanthobacteraceae bacterium]